MIKANLKPFDLSILADNGLRRGRTTGSCAAAAAKAAVLLLEREEAVDSVDIALPGNTHYLPVPVADVKRETEDTVRANVIKIAGDDPDATDGATIFCVIKRNDLGTVRFLAGEGVGIVMEPGIRVPIGEPAINPIPRQMITQAIVDAVGDDLSFDVIIGCERGEEIAKKTFNPRLGIKGGISILGTTGIVEPLSLAAYMASIEVYINVALADAPEAIAIMPGNIGLGFAGKQLCLPKKRVVHISNYLGFALEHIDQSLTQSSTRLGSLWALGHPGKLAKLLDGHWDTHSRASSMAMNAIATFARQNGFGNLLAEKIAQANTVEAIIQLLKDEESGAELWRQLELHLAAIMHAKVPNVDQIKVKLFDMKGQSLCDSSSKDKCQPEASK